MDEFLPGYEASGWLGLGVPGGTPTAIIETLNSAANAVLADSALHARLIGVGIEPTPMSSANFSAFVAAETQKWAKVIRFAHIKPE
jgi:tripartite-type tricarboxylate transporter receptor subunit TctC